MIAINLLPDPLPFAEARQLALRADPNLHAAYTTAAREHARIYKLKRDSPGDPVLVSWHRAAGRAKSAAETAAIHSDPRAYAKYQESLRVKNRTNYARTPWYKGTEEQKAQNRDAWASMTEDPKRLDKRRATRLARHHDKMASDERYVIEARLRSRLRRAVHRGMIRQRDVYGIDWGAIVAHLGDPPGPIDEYHVDHIKPLASFDLNDSDQVRECFAPENHQWLTVADNCRKGAKRE